ncbi:MAG: hypothetical protein PVJ28_06710 [Acidimicrobiia bacterium]|jgi:hypothetical protein
MAQQPNVEITDAERPRPTPQPGPAVKWRADKPGVPVGPTDVRGGGYYGTTGPDPGWGLRLLSQTSLPSGDEHFRDVIAGLMLARAAALGRAPVPEDIQVALALCGYGFNAPPEIHVRRDRWMEAAAHDRRPGATAVAEVDRDLLILKPEDVVAALTSNRS